MIETTIQLKVRAPDDSYDYYTIIYPIWLRLRLCPSQFDLIIASREAVSSPNMLFFLFFLTRFYAHAGSETFRIVSLLLPIPMIVISWIASSQNVFRFFDEGGEIL